jgi:O-antigen ligase
MIALGEGRTVNTRASSPYAFNFLLVSLLAELAWAPFYFGGNDPLAWRVSAGAVGAILIAYETTLYASRRPHPLPIGALATPAALFGVVLIWILLQTATFLPTGLQHPGWRLASDALDEPLSGSISVNRAATWAGLLRLSTAAGVLFLSFELCASRVQARRFLIGIAVVIAAYSILGLAFWTWRPGQVLWIHDLRSVRGVVTSTFMNQNSFATLAAVGVIAWCATAISPPANTGRVGRRCWVTACVMASLLCAAALALTKSRAGIASAGLGLAVLFACSSAFGRRVVGAGIVAAVLGLLALALIGGAGLAPPPPILDAGRVATYKGALAAIEHKPLLGYGYATFADVFPAFRTGDSGLFATWDFAHNSYMESFVGLGVPFGLFLIAAVGLILLQCFKATSQMEGRAAFAALVCVGAHALLDFSLEIQGVTLTTGALLGLGAAAANRRGHQLDERLALRPNPQASPSVNIALGLAGAIMLAGGAALPLTPRSENSRAVLHSQPLSAQAWTDLAAQEITGEQPSTDQALVYWRIAAQLSPNDGYQMFQRALIGLSSWQKLRPSDKKQVGRDLAGAISYLPNVRQLQVLLLISTLGPAARTELRGELLQNGVNRRRAEALVAQEPDH